MTTRRPDAIEQAMERVRKALPRYHEVVIQSGYDCKWLAQAQWSDHGTSRMALMPVGTIRRSSGTCGDLLSAVEDLETRLIGDPLLVQPTD